jgi:hypothetical protein
VAAGARHQESVRVVLTKLSLFLAIWTVGIPIHLVTHCGTLPGRTGRWPLAAGRALGGFQPGARELQYFDCPL